jgi:hypothetical protein
MIIHWAARDRAQPTMLLTYANSVGQAAPCVTDPRAPLTLVKQLPRHACVSRLAGQPDEFDKGVDSMLMRHRKAHDAAQCGRRQSVMVFNTPHIAMHRIPHQIAPRISPHNGKTRSVYYGYVWLAISLQFCRWLTKRRWQSPTAGVSATLCYSLVPQHCPNDCTTGS